MLELLPCHPTLPDRAPLSAYREARKVKLLKYDEALRGLREVVDREAGPKPKELCVAFIADWKSFHPRSRGRHVRPSNPAGR